MQTASCNCGQLSLSVSGDPIRVSVCHCNACQKRTGSAFGVQARYPLSKSLLLVSVIIINVLVMMARRSLLSFAPIAAEIYGSPWMLCKMWLLFH